MGLYKILQEIIEAFRGKTFVNKYTLVIFAFFIWLSFFDRYNLINQYMLSANVRQLEEQNADYEDLLSKALIERETINQDIEKYGREKYYFHKKNEEVILIK